MTNYLQLGNLSFQYDDVEVEQCTDSEVKSIYKNVNIISGNNRYPSGSFLPELEILSLISFGEDKIEKLTNKANEYKNSLDWVEAAKCYTELSFLNENPEHLYKAANCYKHVDQNLYIEYLFLTVKSYINKGLFYSVGRLYSEIAEFYEKTMKLNLL